jgi:CHAT domain-containing protein/tetratricopeptide (TPR) repeat protein
LNSKTEKEIKMSADPFDCIFELHEQAVDLCQQGRYEEALKCALKCLKLARRYYDPHDPDLAVILNGVSQIHLHAGRFPDAESFAVEALEILELLHGPNDPHVARALNNLAGVYYEQGKLTDAIPLFERSADILRNDGEENEHYAQTIHNLAALYGDLGDYARAIPFSVDAMELRRRLLGEDDELYATSLSNLGGLHFESGGFEQAMKLFRKAKAIIRRTHGEDHPAFALCLQHEGGYYHETGRFDRALPILQRSLQIWRSVLPSDHPDIAKGLHNLAGLYLDMGMYERAEPLYLEALAIRRKRLGDEHRLTAGTLNSLAGLYDQMGKAQHVEELFQESMEIRLKTLGNEHPDYAQSLRNLAGFYADTGDLKKADMLYREAARIYRSVWGDRHPCLASVQNGLGALQKQLGNVASAEAHYREALRIRHACFGEDHPTVAHSIGNLALLCASTGRIPEALSLEKWATSVENRMVEQVFAVSSEEQRRAHLDLLSGSVHSFASLARIASSESGASGELMDLVLRRKGIQADALAAQQSSVLARRHPQLRDKLATLDTLRNQIARRQLEGPGENSLSSHQAILDEWLERKEALEEELVRAIPEFRLQFHFLSTDRMRVAGALPRDAALIEFFRFRLFNFGKTGDERWGSYRYLALVLLPDDPEHVSLIDLGEADRIEDLVTEFRQGMVQRCEKRDIEVAEEEPVLGDAHFAKVGSDLRASIFDPLIAAIGPRTRLVMSPDGQLNVLPFETLPLEDGRYVIDRFTIVYVSSGRDVERWGAGAVGQPSDPVIVANPDYNLSGVCGQAGGEGLSDQVQAEFTSEFRAHFSALPETASEARAIFRIAGGGTVWLSEEALDKRIKAVRSPRFLHFATHGLFLRDRPFDSARDSKVGLRSIRSEAGELTVTGMPNPLVRSALALAGVNTWLNQQQLPSEAEDGILTAEEVTAMDLIDTKLVVLSACDTGLGEIRNGEGVFGLRRAFVLAGADTLVMSLWKVPDRETQELMEAFYGRLASGSGRSDALRQAQIEMKAKNPHPFFWGAFICQGNPGPISL